MRNIVKKYDFDDVLIVPRPGSDTVKSRKDVNLTCEVRSQDGVVSWTGIPIIASNMDSTGTFRVAKVMQRNGMLTCMNKKYTIQEYAAEVNAKYNMIWPYACIPSTGSAKKELDACIEIANEIDCKIVCLDVANGYLRTSYRAAAYLKNSLPDKIVIAGNVASPEGAELLQKHGADFVKVGIGSGSVCETRTITGVGYPQFSCVSDCYEFADIVSDGGCKTPGDVAKAFIAGAQFVMIGGMLVGYEEVGTELYGMSSLTAMNGKVPSYKTPEGKLINVKKTTGPLQQGLEKICGGLRSTCTYVGYKSLQDIIGNQQIEFVEVNRQKNNMFDHL